ncbi:thioredoxin-dependent thiol peroxidase [Pollutibacter soli]|uniref:thioredoxin-dependent thiol peroxidase n=1 Tax=Pollutibacter soli TaxID=3034157 RepID=UPI00301346A4
MVSLKPGDKAPLFVSTDHLGNEIDLKELRGKKVILYFYPENDTPTCTEQACNLRDNFGTLKDHNFIVIGVSPDDSESHKKFQSKFHLPFPMIADTDKKIMKKYGVWGEKQMFGHKFMGVHRRTFIIDEKGIIRKIFLRPKVRQHAEEILKLGIQAVKN